MAEVSPSPSGGLMADPTLIGSIAVAVLVGVLLLCILLKRSQSSTSSNDGLTGRYQSILICGPIDSGKTVLFYQLYSSEFKPTQTSMDENILEFKPNGFNNCKTYQFIDYPGHGSKESQIYKYVYKKHNNKGLKAVIFVIDINQTQSAIEGAKILYRLLEKRNFYKRDPKLLILFNKKDLLDQSVNAMKIVEQRKKLMLNELNKLRDSYSTLGSINETNDETESILLGKQNESLKWGDIQCSVQWAVCSAKKGQLEDVQSFLQKL